MKLISLGSGSKGNSIYLEHDGLSLLVDVGFPIRELRKRLAAVGKAPENLDGFLTTHDHKDHAAAAWELMHNLKVPMLSPTNDHPYQYKSLSIQAFPVPHDATAPVGFRFDAGGHKIGLVLDSGEVWDTTIKILQDVETLIIECNHDPDMVWNSDRPEVLRRRILGPLGHLSNEASADAVVRIAGGGTLKRVALAHISQECNDPAWIRTIFVDRFRNAKLSLDLMLLSQTELKEIYADEKPKS